MKKIIPILLIICTCLTLGGCSAEKKSGIHGKSQVEAFRAEAVGWESGRYLFTDLETGETYQVFSFMYNADGTQTCLLERINNGNYYAEYNGGGMIYILDGENLSVINEGNENYVSYSKDSPHPYSTGDLLFYVEPYIKDSSENPDEQGNVTYVYNYDTNKINDSLGTSLTGFSTAYTFDSEGNFLYFAESNSDGDGSYAYMIEVLDANQITEIENPAAG